MTRSGHSGGARAVFADSQRAPPRFASRLIVVVRVRTAPFYGITHIAEYKNRESYHALPLFRTKRFIEWLPRLSEFIQID
jgi:hypothetical protein